MFQSRCNATQDTTLAALAAVPSSSFGPVWLGSDRDESISREVGSLGEVKITKWKTR